MILYNILDFGCNYFVTILSVITAVLVVLIYFYILSINFLLIKYIIFFSYSLPYSKLDI